MKSRLDQAYIPNYPNPGVLEMDYSTEIVMDPNSDLLVLGNTLQFYEVQGQDILLTKLDDQANVLWSSTWGYPRELEYDGVSRAYSTQESAEGIAIADSGEIYTLVTKKKTVY
ncbi:MAG: hypothetical protein ACFFC7_33065, partial [Candidatus Hermodarchaeota archaeon]